MHRKSFLDLIRKLLSRPIGQTKINASDGPWEGSGENSLHNTVTPVTPSLVPQQIGGEGIAIIKQFEGCAKRRADGLVEAYPDPGTGGEPWTIGWGSTGPGIGPETVWTQEECDARLEADVKRYAAEVRQALGDAPTSQAQFDALVSFHYNTGAIGRATLTRKHRAGDFAGAAREFERWCYAGGRVLKGLARRRAAEGELYRSVC